MVTVMKHATIAWLVLMTWPAQAKAAMPMIRQVMAEEEIALYAYLQR